MGNSGKIILQYLAEHTWGVWAWLLGCGVCLCVCHLGVVIAHCGNLMKLWLCVAVPQRAWGCTVTILAEYWHTTPRVLVHCPRELAEYSKSTATVLPGYWCSTPRIQAQHPWITATVLPEYWYSTQRVLAQYSQSRGRVPIPEYLQSTQGLPTPEYSQSVPTVVPEQAHSTDFSTVIIQTQTTTPTREPQPATTPKHRKHRNWWCATTQKQPQRLKTPAQCLKMALNFGSLLRRLLCLFMESRVFFYNFKIILCTM